MFLGLVIYYENNFIKWNCIIYINNKDMYKSKGNKIIFYEYRLRVINIGKGKKEI